MNNRKRAAFVGMRKSVCQVVSIHLHSQALSLPMCYLSSLIGWKQTGIIALNYVYWEKQMKNSQQEDPRKWVWLLLSSHAPCQRLRKITSIFIQLDPKVVRNWRCQDEDTIVALKELSWEGWLRIQRGKSSDKMVPHNTVTASPSPGGLGRNSERDNMGVESKVEQEWAKQEEPWDKLSNESILDRGNTV